jgi:lysozyme
MGDTCTQEQADAWFLEDVAWAEDCVNGAVNVPLTQQEFDACVSLCFNIGYTAFKGSTLVRKLNESDYDAASLQFLRWDKQRGQVLAGLTKRRMAEVRLFEQEVA